MTSKIPNFNLLGIFAESNRGMLLDIVVFIINLVLMSFLTAYFANIIRLAGEDDPSAQFLLLVCSVAMFVLPAAGAVLKRWHFHQRRKLRNARPSDAGGGSKRKSKAWSFDPLEPESNAASGCANAGCLFSAIFYFVLSIFLSAVAMSLLQTLILGKSADNPAFFVPLVIISFVLCVVQTALVYRYFFPPKKPPRGSFRRDPRSELIGDLCIFANMILFQVFWNIVIRELPSLRVTRVSDFAGNLFFLSFVAFLVYFPPRIFFLAEDFGRPATWITIFLANSPTIVRFLFGMNQTADW